MQPLLAALLAVIIQSPPSDSLATGVADAYLDAAAARMVASARAETESANERIEAYEMLAKQRMSVGMRALRRERLIFRREIASRVTWTKGGERRVEVLGAREVIPVAIRGVRVVEDDDLRSSGADLLIDPMSNGLVRIPTDEDEDVRHPLAEGEEDVRHPLAEGSEAHYRFRSGETTTIRLADGQTIRLIELQVIPRRSRPDLLSGSFWLDAETNAPVRGVFRLAAPLRFAPTARVGFIPVSLPEASFTIRYLTLEYGLWEGEWWLPRLIAFEGSAAIGGLSVPASLEQSFQDYRIYAGSDPWSGFEPIDTTAFRTVRRVCPDDAEEECRQRIVLVPRDTTLLLAGEHLPTSIYSDGRQLVSEREVGDLVGLLSVSEWRGMRDRIPRVAWKPIDASLLHYNRVEGLTVGTSASIDLEPLSAAAAAWMGLADRSPSFRLGVDRWRHNGQEQLGFYRRLEAFSPRDRPFSLGSSVSAFAFGNDDGDYYRALGAALVSEQAPAAPASLYLRLFVERQTPVEKQTDASIPHWSNDEVFRPNPPADEADQIGLEARVHFTRGLDPLGFRGGFETGVRAERGTFDFARPWASVFANFPLPGGLAGALEGSIGTSFGELPAQGLWYVGGRGSVRGIRADDRRSGEAYWHTRAELGTDLPAARLVLFSDAGWAGARGDVTGDPALVSGGVGVSFLDGLIRADVARVVKGGSGWAFQLYLDAPL